jgi:hypothetical protein
MKPGNNKTGFDSMLRRGLSSDSTRAEQGCPEPEVLAAYYERSLAPAEIDQFDAHLATCARCRKQIAALVRSEPHDEKPLDAPASWLWNWRWLAPAVTAVAIVLIWVGIRAHHKVIKEPVNVAMTQTTAPLEPVPQPPQPQLAPPSRTVTGDGLSKPAATPTFGKKFSEASPQGLAKQNGGAPTAASGRASAGEPPSFTGEGAGVSSAGGVLGGAAPAPPPPPRDDSALSATLAQSAPADVTSTANSNATRLAAPQASGAGGATARREFSLSAKRPASAPQAKASSTAADQLQVREASPNPIVIRSPDATKSWRIAVSGAIEFSADSGVTWEMQRPEIAGAMTTGFAPSAKVCWIVGRSGAVLRTANGTDWKQVTAPTSQDLTGVTAWSAKRAQVTAADASVFVTKDGGKSWTQQNNP